MSIDSTTAPPGFTPLRTLGRGGSGTVVEAHHGSTGRTVALKILDVQPTDGDALRRFDRERGVMAELATHPGIVSIIDAGMHLGRPWIAMDLCRRGSMAGIGRLPADGVLTTMHAVAEALAAAHARGVTHCDVKPANILVTDYGRAALGDFGVARLALGEGSGSTVGGYTLDHVAPEVIDGCHPTDRSDVFSLGTTAWQLIMGRPPFRRPGDAPAAVLGRLRAEPLPALDVPVPAELVDLLHAMTSKMPVDRPSAGRVAEAVARLAERHQLVLHRPLDEIVPITTQVRTGTTHPSLPGTPQAAPLLPSSPLVGTDHRPDLSRLTHAGTPPPARAAVPVLGGAITPSRRDRLVTAAVAATVVVVLASVAVATSRLLPTSAPAQIVTSASGETQVVPDLGIQNAPGLPAEPTLLAAASEPVSSNRVAGNIDRTSPRSGAAAPVVPAPAAAPGAPTGPSQKPGPTPPSPVKAPESLATLEMMPSLDCTAPNPGQCAVGPGTSTISLRSFVGIDVPAGEAYPDCTETITFAEAVFGTVVFQGSNGCNYRSPTYVPDTSRFVVGNSYKVSATGRIKGGATNTKTIYFEVVAG